MSDAMKLTIVLTGWLLLSAAAQAQFPIGGQPRPLGGLGAGSPTVSPYINLLRSNSSTLVNYYGLVRPEQNFAQALQGLNSQQQMNSAALNAMDPNATPSSGTSIRFMNTQPYFMSINRGGGMGGFGGAMQGVVQNQTFGTMGRGGLNANSPFGVSGLTGAPTNRTIQSPMSPVQRPQ
jgi:hypothetical protein